MGEVISLADRRVVRAEPPDNPLRFTFRYWVCEREAHTDAAGDFRGAWAIARANGWRSYREDGEWHKSCPECVRRWRDRMNAINREAFRRGEEDVERVLAARAARARREETK